MCIDRLPFPLFLMLFEQLHSVDRQIEFLSQYTYQSKEFLDNFFQCTYM
jgi:hypothetical protein